MILIHSNEHYEWAVLKRDRFQREVRKEKGHHVLIVQKIKSIYCFKHSRMAVQLIVTFTKSKMCGKASKRFYSLKDSLSFILVTIVLRYLGTKKSQKSSLEVYLVFSKRYHYYLLSPSRRELNDSIWALVFALFWVSVRLQQINEKKMKDFEENWCCGNFWIRILLGELSFLYPLAEERNYYCSFQRVSQRQILNKHLRCWFYQISWNKFKTFHEKTVLLESTTQFF